MKELMLDIEAVDTRPNAAILQIGACYFDRNTGKIGKTFSINIDLKSCIEKGLTVSGDTLYWWFEQSDEARISMTKKPRGKIETALNKFKTFTKEAKCIWCHATYDFPIVNNAMIVCGIKPMNFLIARDIRTVTDLANVKLKDFKREGVHHTALDDCIFQVEYVTTAVNKLKNE